MSSSRIEIKNKVNDIVARYYIANLAGDCSTFSIGCFYLCKSTTPADMAMAILQRGLEDVHTSGKAANKLVFTHYKDYFGAEMGYGRIYSILKEYSTQEIINEVPSYSNTQNFQIRILVFPKALQHWRQFKEPRKDFKEGELFFGSNETFPIRQICTIVAKKLDW